MFVLVLGFIIVLLDQATKHLVRRNLLSGEIVTVIPGLFDLRYVTNTGAAWGILQGLNHWLVALSVVMLVLMAVFHRSFVMNTRPSKLSAGLIVGGIVGNLIDRLRLSFVVDFLDFYWRGHHFPCFNVADSAICIGVGLYILLQVLDDRSRREPIIDC